MGPKQRSRLFGGGQRLRIRRHSVHPWDESDRQRRIMAQQDDRDIYGCDLCGKNKPPHHACYPAGLRGKTRTWKDSRKRHQWA